MPDPTTAQPQAPLTPPSPIDAPDEKPINPFPKKILIAFGVLGVILIFFSGFFIRGAFERPEVKIVPTNTPTPTKLVITTPTPTPFSEVVGSTVQFLPRKQYFDDTYVLISKNKPYRTVIISVSRIEQEKNYLQFVKINYFNGKDWVRKTVSNSLTNSNVVVNPILRKFNDATTIQQNRPVEILELMLDKESVIAQTFTLNNEISVQSLPGSTKFIYQGNATLLINDEPEQAYIFYARTYSFNASDLAFLSKPESLKAEWAVFWDKDGIFYHLDTVHVPDAKTAIQNRQIGIKETVQRAITRTTRASGTSQLPGPQFIVTLGDPIAESIRYPFTNAINKSDNKSYQWLQGTGEATLVKERGSTISGVGVFEYIAQVTR